MRVAAKVGSYGFVLVALLGGGLAVGERFGPDTAVPATEHETGSGAGEEPGPKEDLPMGSSIASEGYRLEPETTALAPGVAGTLRFRVLGPDGQAVTEYDETHERRLHLIVVSRDLAWFEHVHPELGTDGVWQQTITFPAGGPYRAYADFAPSGGENLVLGMDLSAAGEYRPAPLAAVEDRAVVDRHTVTLAGHPTAGEEADLRFTVEAGGKAVTDLDRYLGAAGHLVALRAGDLAYLHVHPTSEGLGPDVGFAAHFPSAGTYRLFLDFSHGGDVRTVAFTVDVPAPTGQPAGGGQETAGADDHSH